MSTHVNAILRSGTIKNREIMHDGLYNSEESFGLFEEELLKRPLKTEIKEKIWSIIDKRLKKDYHPSGGLSATCVLDEHCNIKYIRNGFIRETDEYDCNDIGTAILKYTKEKGIIVPFGLTVGKNNNVAIYKLNKDYNG